MPELPEVETTRRGLEPYWVGQRMKGAVVREARLRYPVPPHLAALMAGRQVTALRRRGKYLVVDLDDGAWVLLHLGMSGRLRLVGPDRPAGRHDHVDLLFADDRRVRLTDPRRFGAVLVGSGRLEAHPLLAHLGPEPLQSGFTGDYLYTVSRARRQAVKAFLMDAKVVVGVGNIYANEALYRAGVDPRRAAGRVSRARYVRLVAAVRTVLEAALRAGGTTLRDYTDDRGRAGYFKLELAVYGGGACHRCGAPLRTVRIAQRGTWYCPNCQR